MATLKSGNIESEEVGGAYVNAWISFPDKDGAESLAKFYIDAAGWSPGLTRDSAWFEETGDVAEEDRGYFLEASCHGSCLVFHEWPKHAEDTNVEYDIN